MILKTLNEIAKNIIDAIHDSLPDVDTKEGTFVRDVFINPISAQIFQLYQDAKIIDFSQSILTATGTDLDRLAQNFFVKRKGATLSTGKVRFFLGSNPPANPITIPKSSIVYTQISDNKKEKYFQTSATIDVLPGNPATYLFDSMTNQYYVDVDATSVYSGQEMNIGTGEIAKLGEGFPQEVTGVTNPFGFSGGTDAEDDNSLALRVSLAITGSNIGTKDGYTSFILRQEGVIDAKVIGAGDPLMKRDNGEGGMVDIYVRAETDSDAIYNFNIDYNYITDTSQRPAYDDIKLPKQPVVRIISIIGNRTGLSTPIVYLNGSDYNLEQGSNNFYFQDQEWTFTQPSGNSSQELAVAFLNEKLSQINYLNDVKYNLDWASIKESLNNDTIALPLDPYFDRGFYSDGLIYMIRSKNDSLNPYIGGRYFIQKNGIIYERLYVTPDFVFNQDLSDYGKSIQGKDSIKWLPTNSGAKRPIENETLTIKYSWNSIIEDLQNKVEDKRVLTADVLVKQAKEVEIEIKIDVVPYVDVTPLDVKTAVINKISSYVNSVKQLGASINRSDIVSTARLTPGVKSVDIENVYISKLNGIPEKELQIEGFEYFELNNIVVNVLSNDKIV